MRYWPRHCLLLVALCSAGCAFDESDEADDIDDLGTLGDGKADTVLPRTVAIDVGAGQTKRFRVTAATFVATLSQEASVSAQLSVKHLALAADSEVVRAPRIVAPSDGSDGTVRNWTLTVRNRGTARLVGTLVIDIVRDTRELGIVSDIDKTVLPPETAAGMPPPYPGIAALLRTLELRGGGIAGDMHFVTARSPERVVDLPDWMAMHGVPAGVIETGISGIPNVAQREKIADITRIFEARVGQKFVLFGDTSQRDPEVYAAITAKFPDQVAATFIHKVTATVPPERVAGMHLVDNYAQAAAQAFGDALLTEAEARSIMTAARDGGLALTDDDIDALIDAAR